MSSVIKKMSNFDKITIFFLVVGFLLSFVSLALSDSVSRIINKSELVATKNTVSLESLIENTGVVDVVKIINKGGASSINVKVIFDFVNDFPKFKIFSDENIEQISSKDNRLSIQLKRLSSNSNIKITMYSDTLLTYNMSYVDDNGNYSIKDYSEPSKRSLLDVFLIFLIISFLIAIFWIFNKASKEAFIQIYKNHQDENQLRLREIRDAIINIDPAVNESNDSSSGSGSTQRLTDLLNRLTSTQ